MWRGGSPNTGRTFEQCQYQARCWADQLPLTYQTTYNFGVYGGLRRTCWSKDKRWSMNSKTNKVQRAFHLFLEATGQYRSRGGYELVFLEHSDTLVLLRHMGTKETGNADFFSEGKVFAMM